MQLQQSEYIPEHPELIPANEEEARDRLKTAVEVHELSCLEEIPFLHGWWALFWLHPGLHPDGWEDWDSEFHRYWPLAVEAFRRRKAGLISDGLLYPADATHDRLKREQEAIGEGHGTPVEPGDHRVLIRNAEGLYLAKDESGAIAWVAERSEAFRYYRRADAVDAQVREVKRRYDQKWIIELSDPRGEDLAGVRVIILAGPDAGEEGVCLGSAPDGRWAVSASSSSEVHNLIYDKEFALLVDEAPEA